ncbi:MAG: ATP-binding protein [Clostridia bacterium]|nr:ATP-binding protein [Clostridia bacterium]
MISVRQKKGDAITARLFQNAMLTMLVAELSGAFTAVIDGIITGQFLGPVSLAAFGIGTPYFSIASIVSGILMVGSTAMCTRAIGRGDKTELTRVFSLTILLGAVASVLLAALGFGFADSLASLFGAKASASSLHGQTAQYLRGIFLGAPGFIMFVILTPLLQLDGDSLRPQLASIVMAIVDIGGDVLNVTVFKGGLFGMALASTFSHYAALLVLLTHFIKKSDLFTFSLREVGLKTAPKLMSDGLPRAACMLCRGILPIVINSLALKLAGDSGVAAYSTMNSTTFVVGSLGWGIGGAVLIMGGMTVGEQDTRGLVTVIKTALKDILIGVVLLAAAVFAAAPLIAGLFITEAGEIRDMAAAAIRCYAAALPFLAFNVSASNHFQSISRKAEAYAVNICIELVCTALAALALSSFIGVTGLWLAFPTGQALLSLAIALRAVFGRDGKRKGLASFLMLRKDFGVNENDCVERSVVSMDDVIALSVDVGEFCSSHGIGKKEANRVALCIEEMAGNVVEHGFADGKPHHLDVRVIVKDGKTVLRMRDDCAFFDLREQAKKWSFDPEHPEKNIGIRMVMGASEDVVYTRTMKTNNLIVTVKKENAS